MNHLKDIHTNLAQAAGDILKINNDKCTHFN